MGITGRFAGGISVSVTLRIVNQTEKLGVHLTERIRKQEYEKA
jgi:hypothetical protein